MSIFARALGPDFDRLHPMMRRRFGVAVAAGYGCVGTGTMDHVWRTRDWVRPFLWLGSWRNILVPVSGRDVPFTIENYPYRDTIGRETVSFVRTFELPRRRARFDATMVYDRRRDVLVDYLGTHQHLATDLTFEVTEGGGLVIRSHEQRFYEGPLRFRFPAVLTGTAELHESYDEAVGRFRIRVEVSNPVLGPLFGYAGTFACRWPEVGPDGEGVPASVKPLREERRP
ncbi:DUF4166 domain-containing protein [Pseudactinotalea suaedae]|uniref:DUF4166 domain-containing protein n=1 Tax=Pseudactinotalea suaedae TaxID=1524924 RepID=UPI0012E1C60D|nr:DUF4166 domain-containing protein [Pseudactinotalea suaedae]